MHYNPVSQKTKIILHTKYLTAEEVIEFFEKIKVLKQLSVQFYDPYLGDIRTINCYRGDRKITMKWDRTDNGILFAPTSISLIEL